MSEFVTKNVAETEQLAERLAKKLSGGEVLAFFGGMGAGKTHFITGLSRALGYLGEVSSPTFNIVNEYIGGRLNVYHFDMYRVSTWNDLYTTGYFDYLEMGGVMAVEWSENIEEALEETAIKIEISIVDETTRKFLISGVEL